jgi:ribosome-binding factor A
MKRRAQQVGATIRRELQLRIARGFNDPRIRGMITVTRVEMTDDLKRVKAFITVMPEERASVTMHGLKAALPRIRRDVMNRIHIKEAPALEFVYDEGTRAQRVISELLAKDRIERGAMGIDSDDEQATHEGDDDTSTETTQREP